MSLNEITVEWEVFAAEGTVGIGGVRSVHSDHLLIHIEGFGEVNIRADQIRSAHDHKVILETEKLSEDLREAISHAHDAERRS